MISVTLLTLHAYNPIPKLSSFSKGGDTVPAKYYNNFGIDDAPDAHDEGHVPDVVKRANATFLMLARNSEIEGAVRTIKELEDGFNRNYHYPWVFLNEKHFSDDFKRCASPPIPLLSVRRAH